MAVMVVRKEKTLVQILQHIRGMKDRGTGEIMSDCVRMCNAYEDDYKQIVL